MITFGLSIEARTRGEYWWRIGGILGLGWIQFMLGRKELKKKTLFLARLLASPCGGEAESGWNLLVGLVPEQV